MAASGLPLVVSNLQGFAETIAKGKTGYSFEPGNHIELSERIIVMLDDTDNRNIMGENAR